MKQPRVIQRLSSLLLAVLLLFTAAWGPAGLADRQSAPTPKAATKGVKANKPASSSKSDETRVKAAGFEAVVTPAVTVHDGAGQTAFLLPAPTLLILLLLSVPLLRRFGLPHYYFAYFRHVFGHAIAPNAP